MTVVVLGQIARDLVLRCDGLPQAGSSVNVVQRREMLGGKGANQSVALAQLGVPTALIGVVGDDPVGTEVVRQATADGIDTAGILRRGSTALMVDIVDEPGSRRLFEDVPDSAVLSVDDLDRVGGAVDSADIVSLQMQQPGATMLAAAERAQRGGARVVADGYPQPDVCDRLLPLLNVIRLDAKEAELLAGEPVQSVDAASAFGQRLLDRGPQVVALAIPDAGDLLVWRQGSQLFPHGDTPVVDKTGAGDAFVAGLVAALRGGADPGRAGALASAAAASTVGRLGGRPDVRGLEV